MYSFGNQNVKQAQTSETIMYVDKTKYKNYKYVYCVTVTHVIIECIHILCSVFQSVMVSLLHFSSSTDHESPLESCRAASELCV